MNLPEADNRRIVTAGLRTDGGADSGGAYHRAFYRQKDGDNTKTRKLFIVLRSLPGAPSADRAHELMQNALDNGVKSMAVLSQDDYFYNDNGEYVFDKNRLKEVVRLNFQRATIHFTQGTELVILNNYNTKKSHYRHYVACAVAHGYDAAELTVGKTTGLTDAEFAALAAATNGRVPEQIIRAYAKSFEPS